MRYAIAAFLCCLAWSPTTVQAKPMRSECIIGFHLDWSKVNADRRDVANEISLANRTDWIEPLIALMFQQRHSELYFMLKDECETKTEIAKEQIEKWRNKGISLPEFERIPDPIFPSTDTIEVRGPYWRDGMPDGIPPCQFNAAPEDQPI